MEEKLCRAHAYLSMVHQRGVLDALPIDIRPVVAHSIPEPPIVSVPPHNCMHTGTEWIGNRYLALPPTTDLVFRFSAERVDRARLIAEDHFKIGIHVGQYTNDST